MNPAAAPARRIGLLSATTLVVASMLGTGVFTTSGFLLEELGSPWLVLLAWLAGGLLATCGALSYGALARQLPGSGGEYYFLSRTLHPAAGVVAGWISIVAGFAAPLAAASLAFAEYVGDWFPGVAPQALGSTLLVAFAAVHALGEHRGTRLHDLTVVAEVLLVVVFVTLALARVPSELAVHAPSARADLSAFALALIWVSFSYSGWNAAVYVGGEVRDAERALPRALFLGTALITGLYLALNAAFVFAAPPARLAGQADVGRLAAAALGGQPWADALTLLIAVVLAASVSAMTVAGARVHAQMAADGELPHRLAAGDRPPRAALALQCTLALLMLWTSSFRSLLTYIGFTLNLCSAATVVGLIRLRLREGTRLPVAGWPFVPAIFLLAVLGMTLGAIFRQPTESACGLATLAAAWLIWRWRSRHHHRSPSD
ncbi:APC family permease [Accumulibacter sp.]|uniref:APC family permease n=1 Tax=Accumulibacter sp. TaxID=2053492 RepID=UPI0025D53C76|nr:amino acid permease [Accumulibacter sp.]MCM8596495.1 amino acid permease [Accumulibacter sp.]MCM8627333.1 amino acid permease [Accumulibacter sp.]MDS4050643.1 amino acid permease [Accumulibacter sp.]